MMSTAGMSYWDAFVPALVILLIALAVLPWVNRNNTIVRAAAIVLCLVLGWRYMLWRIFETIPSSSNPIDFFTGPDFRRRRSNCDDRLYGVADIPDAHQKPDG